MLGFRWLPSGLGYMQPHSATVSGHSVSLTVPLSKSVAGAGFSARALFSYYSCSVQPMHAPPPLQVAWEGRPAPPPARQDFSEDRPRYGVPFSDKYPAIGPALSHCPLNHPELAPNVSWEVDRYGRSAGPTLVPQIRNLADLAPVEEVGARPMVLQDLLEPAFVRRVAVFHGGLSEGSEPCLLQVDARLFRPTLDQALLTALGLSPSEATVIQLQTTFPTLPTEQFVIRSRSLPWYMHAVPVGSLLHSWVFVVVVTPRDATCMHVVREALQRGSQQATSAHACTCHPGSYTAEEQPLLAPSCDAVILSNHEATLPLGDLRVAQVGLTQLVAGSMSLENQSGAMVFTDNGWIQLDFPAHDPVTPPLLGRRFPDLPGLHLSQLPFPLPGFPTAQFVASPSDPANGLSLVVDLRACQLGVVVVPTPRFSCCRDVAQAAVRRWALDAHQPYEAHEIDWGWWTCFLHDQPVHADSLLDLSPFLSLSLAPTPRANSPEGLPTFSQADGAIRHVLGSQLFMLFCALRLYDWAILVPLATCMQPTAAARGHSAPPMRPGRLYGRTAQASEQIGQPASAATHAAIHADLMASGRLSTPSLSPSPLGDDDPRVVHFMIWSPQIVWSTHFPAYQSWGRVLTTIMRDHRVDGKLALLPIASPPDFTHVHLVAVTGHRDVATIIIRLQEHFYCVEVQPLSAGAQVHQWARDRLGHDVFRVDCSFHGLTRHGDVCTVVVAAQHLRPTLLDISTFSLAFRDNTAHTGSVRRHVFPLLQPEAPHLWLPITLGVPARETVNNMLNFVRPTSDAPILIIDLPPHTLGHPPHPVLLAAPQGSICTVVWLVDRWDAHNLGAAFAIRGVFATHDELLQSLEALPGNPGAVRTKAGRIGIQWWPKTQVCQSNGGAVICEVITAAMIGRQALTWLDENSLSSAPPYARLAASNPLEEVSVASSWSTSSLGAAAEICSSYPGLDDPTGTLRAVFCAPLRITCVVPCRHDKIAWALVVEETVFGLCTTSVDWAAVATVSGRLLPDMREAVVQIGPTTVHWPAPLYEAAYTCGILHFRSSAVAEDCSREAEHTLLLPHNSAPTLACAWCSLLLPAWAFVHRRPGLGLLLTAPLLRLGHAMIPISNPTQASVHAAVAAPLFLTLDEVTSTWQQQALPMDEIIRIWLSCQGPLTFSLAQILGGPDVRTRLLARGFRPNQDRFFRAFDACTDAQDFICVPPGSGPWWVIRDVAGRETLRPVRYLTVNHQVWPVTLNEEGQIITLITNGRPQGARASLDRRVPDHWGAVTAVGLSFISATTRSSLARLGLYLSLAAVVRAAPTGFSTMGTCRIWTYGIFAPADITAAGQTATDVKLALVRAHPAFRLSNDGDLFPATPRDIHGTQRWLYVPRRVGQGPIYILCQWRESAAVFACANGILDWDALIRWATSTFTMPATRAHQFALVYGEHVFRYGGSLTGLAQGHVLSIGIAQDTPCPQTYLDPWEQETDIPLNFVSSWGQPILRGPGHEPIQAVCLNQWAASADTAARRAMVVRTNSSTQTNLSFAPESSGMHDWVEAANILRRLDAQLAAGVEANLNPAAGPTAVNLQQDPATTNTAKRRSAKLLGGLCILLVCSGRGLVCDGLLLWLMLGLVPAVSSAPAGSCATPEHAVFLPTWGSPDSTPTRNATPSQYAYLQETVLRLWRDHAEDGAGQQSPDWPRTAITIQLHHHCLEAQPVVCHLLIQDNCLSHLHQAVQSWALAVGSCQACPVLPQPDSTALHFIASAASPDLAAVLLRWGDRLWARALPRLCSDELRSYQIRGICGTISPPVGATLGAQIVLRDGDYLHFYPRPLSAWYEPSESDEPNSTTSAVPAGLVSHSSSKAQTGVHMTMLSSLLLPFLLPDLSWSRHTGDHTRLWTRALALAIVGLYFGSTPAEAMHQADHILHMSCHAHGDCRNLPPFAPRRPSPVALADLVGIEPRSIVHILWQGQTPAVSVRMCSCTPRKIVEICLLADIPEHVPAHIALEAAPPPITAVHWTLSHVSPTAETFMHRDPGHSSSSRGSAAHWVLLALALLHDPRWCGIFLLQGASAMWNPHFRSQAVDVGVGSFMWNQRPADRTLVSVAAGRHDVWVRYFSPFRGESQAVQIPARSTWREITLMCLHNDLPWASSATPVWPAFETPLLTVVPVAPDVKMACIIVSATDWGLPSMVTRQWLLEAVRYMSPGPFSQLYLPLLQQPDGPGFFAIRNGDVFYAAPIDDGAPAQRGGVVEVARPDTLRHATLWQRPFILTAPMHCHMWFPERDVKVCRLPAGTAWSPRDARFSVFTTDLFPGRWTPCPWSRGPSTHLVPVSNQAAHANVLVYDPSGPYCETWPRFTSPADIAGRLRHWGNRPWAVAGYVQSGSAGTSDLQLRDGDVISPSMCQPLPQPATSSATRPSQERTLATLIVGWGIIGRRFPGLTAALMMVLVSPRPCMMSTPPVTARSRSSSSSRGTGAEILPQSVPVGLYHDRGRPAFPTHNHTCDITTFESVQALCPLYGTYSPLRGLADGDADVAHELWRSLSHWHSPLMPVWPALCPPHLQFVPCPPAPLICILVWSGDTLRSHLVLQSIPWDRQTFLFGGYLTPPHATRFDVDGRACLRHGDVCWTRDSGAASSHQPAGVHNAASARHHTLWQRPFRVLGSCPITLWRPGQEPKQDWLPLGATWNPTLSRFDGEWTGAQEDWTVCPWIPLRGLHLCQRATAAHICHVLLPDSTVGGGIVCLRLDRTSPCWTQRYHIRGAVYTAHEPQPRDGDFLEPLPPTLSGASPNPYIRTLLAATLGLSVRPTWLGVAILSMHLLANGAGSDEEDSSGTPRSRSPSIHDRPGPLVTPRSVRVGLFHQSGVVPWRPLPDTIGIHQYHDLQFLCPLSGQRRGLKVPGGLSETDVDAFFRQGLPQWERPWVPVWPAISLSTLHMVPCPPEPLVCVVVTGEVEPRACLVLRTTPAACLPRALGAQHDFSWPLSIRHKRVTGQNPYLRNGDVFLARGSVETRVPGPMQVLLTTTQARHHAIWQNPFVLAQAGEVTLWRPLQPPRTTRLPAGATWHPKKGRFSSMPWDDTISWDPVPWIPSEGLSLCLRSNDPGRVNVILWTQPPRCISRREVEPELAYSYCVRGPTDGSFVRTLRNGDVLLDNLHMVAGSSAQNRPSTWFPLFLGALCQTRRGFGFLRCLALATILSATPGLGMQAEVTRYLWCPYEITRVVSSEAELREPGYTQVAAADAGIVQHWIANSRSSDLVHVLVMSGSSVRALALPPAIPGRFLHAALRQTHADDRLAGPEGLLPDDLGLWWLRHGDVFLWVPQQWRPLLRSLVAAGQTEPLPPTGHIQWRRPFALHAGAQVCLWHHDGRGPVFTYGPPGERWSPRLRTFLPLFASTFPGAWVYAGFCDGRHHFVPGRQDTLASVLVGDASLACHLLPRGQPWFARDGDHIHALQPVPVLGRDADRSHVHARTARVLSTLTPARHPGRLALSCFLGWAQLTRPTRVRVPATVVRQRQLCSQLWDCYLCPRGAPGLTWEKGDNGDWLVDLTGPARLQEASYGHWIADDIPTELPGSAPRHIRTSWQSYPVWTRGVPDQLLIATDGRVMGLVHGLLLSGGSREACGAGSAGNTAP